MSGEQNNKQRVRFSATGFYVELWEACLAHQGGRCAICGCALVVAPVKIGGIMTACADHDHTVKLPRGILCMGCNTALGTYEGHQRAWGMRIEPYEAYLAHWPTRAFVNPQRAQRKRKAPVVRTMPRTIKEWRAKNT